MKKKIQPINKAVYGGIGTFVVTSLVQLLVSWLNSNNLDVTPDQQTQLIDLFYGIMISIFTSLGAAVTVYQAPANKPKPHSTSKK